MPFHIVIPARYQSSRLPGKPLLDIGGKTMIQHVYQRAMESNAESVIVATDDQRIYDVVIKFGGECIVTSSEHKSGTDRIAEVAKKRAWGDDEIIVNVQGDEPLIPPENIQQCAEILLNNSQSEMATLCVPIDDISDYFDPNIVKVTINKNSEAMYFSRASIPWHRDHLAINKSSMPPSDMYFRHIGIYAYRCGFLQKFVDYGPCEMELTESLEQLRALWNGHKIVINTASMPPGPGVDTEEDLIKVRQLI